MFMVSMRTLVSNGTCLFLKPWLVGLSLYTLAWMLFMFYGYYIKSSLNTNEDFRVVADGGKLDGDTVHALPPVVITGLLGSGLNLVKEIFENAGKVYFGEQAKDKRFFFASSPVSHLKSKKNWLKGKVRV